MLQRGCRIGYDICFAVTIQSLCACMWAVVVVLWIAEGGVTDGDGGGVGGVTAGGGGLFVDQSINQSTTCGIRNNQQGMNERR